MELIMLQNKISKPHHTLNEEKIEKMPSTQQSISPDYSPDNYELTTPHNKNTPFPKTTIQSTVKFCVALQ